jgi:hypothetical protein
VGLCRPEGTVNVELMALCFTFQLFMEVTLFGKAQEAPKPGLIDGGCIFALLM